MGILRTMQQIFFSVCVSIYILINRLLLKTRFCLHDLHFMLFKLSIMPALCWMQLLLCSKLCQHNSPRPSHCHKIKAISNGMHGIFDIAAYVIVLFIRMIRLLYAEHEVIISFYSSIQQHNRIFEHNSPSVSY